VLEALNAGYKHIDAAAVYGNQKEIGDALQKWGGNRDDIWVRLKAFLIYLFPIQLPSVVAEYIERSKITSKLWNTRHRAGDVEAALMETLSDLQVDYVDLYLIHWRMYLLLCTLDRIM
jgi:diketogulonate reductase-like aldo/keto reductase